MVFQSFWSHLFSSYKSLDKALPLEAVGSKVFPKVVGEVIKVTLEAVKSSCIKKESLAVLQSVLWTSRMQGGGARQRRSSFCVVNCNCASFFFSFITCKKRIFEIYMKDPMGMELLVTFM